MAPRPAPTLGTVSPIGSASPTMIAPRTRRSAESWDCSKVATSVVVASAPRSTGRVETCSEATASPAAAASFRNVSRATLCSIGGPTGSARLWKLAGHCACDDDRRRQQAILSASWQLRLSSQLDCDWIRYALLQFQKIDSRLGPTSHWRCATRLSESLFFETCSQ
jgi:hypothetical protein